MKLDLTPEQAFFAGTTRQFLDDRVPTSLLRGDPAGFGRDFWRQGADLGWTSLLVPEADGGGSVSGTIEMSRNGVSERFLGMPREGAGTTTSRSARYRAARPAGDRDERAHRGGPGGGGRRSRGAETTLR